MTSGEKKRWRSLRTKSFRVILLVALLVTLVASIVGLALFGYSSLRNYKTESKHLMNYALSLEDSKYLEKIFKETREIYEGMDPEIRKKPFSDKYVKTFLPLIDDDFHKARDILVKCREKTEQKNMFLMFTDPKQSAIVYVVDGDKDEWAYIPGQWIKADLKAVENIQKSYWRLWITHEDDYGWVGTDYEPFYDSKGKQIGYAVVDLDLNDFLGRVFHFLIVLLPVEILLIILIAYFSTRLLKKNIITHLTTMATAAREYIARDKVQESEESKGSVFGALDIKTSDELEDLCNSMIEMEADVKDTMQRLRQITAERERMDAELSIATQIQEGVLPRTFPAFPDRPEFGIYGSMYPAKEVGGDLYDFFLVDDDHLAMVIADVSGKGISAALFMVISKTLIKNQVQQGLQDPAEIFNDVNQKLIDVNNASMFVTAWLGILEISTGELTYVNAGHEYPAIKTGDAPFAVEKDVHGPPLAASRKVRFKSGKFSLKPGDVICQYTDGITEAHNAQKEMFGEERMLEALNLQPDADPQEIDKNVHDGIAAFVQDAEQFDDTTMLCLKYYGPREPAGEEKQ